MAITLHRRLKDVPIAHESYLIECHSQAVPPRFSRVLRAHNMSIDTHANRPVAPAFLDEGHFKRHRGARLDPVGIDEISAARADIVDM